MLFVGLSVYKDETVLSDSGMRLEKHETLPIPLPGDILVWNRGHVVVTNPGAGRPLQVRATHYGFGVCRFAETSLVDATPLCFYSGVIDFRLGWNFHVVRMIEADSIEEARQIFDDDVYYRDAHGKTERGWDARAERMRTVAPT